MNQDNVVLEAPPEEHPTPTLTVSDRCDSCGAQAYVSVLFETGELLFCGHDWNLHKKKMVPMAVKVVNETYRLLQS